MMVELSLRVLSLHHIHSEYGLLLLRMVVVPSFNLFYLTLEEEHAFLVPFFSRAEKGQIATAGEIKRGDTLAHLRPT